MSYSILRVVFLGMLVTGAACAPEQSGKTKAFGIFAAASLAEVVEAFADSFSVDFPQYAPEIHVAATSVLSLQIRWGAPTDLILTADSIWMNSLLRDSLVTNPVFPISNRMVWISGRSANAPDPTRIENLSIADPEQVPAGRYAREALQCLGIWSEFKNRLIPARDVRAALATVQNGYADAGIVYASDVLLEKVTVRVTPIEPRCQPRIRYGFARVKSGPNREAADTFLEYITRPAASRLWSRFGFVFCGDPGSAC